MHEACEHPSCIALQAAGLRLNSLIRNDPEFVKLVEELAKVQDVLFGAALTEVLETVADASRLATLLQIRDVLVDRARKAENN